MQKGFTLIEILLSVAIITLLVGLSLPVYESFVRRNDLDLTTQNIVSTLRRAQVYARSGDQDSDWGVRVDPSSLTLFKGATYSTRNTAFDEVVPIPASMSASGITDMVFAELSGAPSTTGSYTLTSTTNDVRTVTVNAKGMVNY